MDCAKLMALGFYHESNLWEYVKGRNPYGLEHLPLALDSPLIRPAAPKTGWVRWPSIREPEISERPTASPPTMRFSVPDIR